MSAAARDAGVGRQDGDDVGSARPRDFPHGFLWGAATAAHQVEGGTTGNDWAQWERQGHPNLVEPVGVGIDQWRRWRQDVALLAELGHTAHRFSLEWSRLEPAPGHFDRAAFDHYAEVLDGVAEAGMLPMLTLQHFTVPAWFADRGGWLADDAAEVFGRFAGECARRLRGRAPLVCTVNEPQIVAVFGHLLGAHPPGTRDRAAAVRAGQSLRGAHRAAVRAYAEEDPQAQLGIALALHDLVPADGGPAAAAATADLDALMTGDYLDDLSAGDDRGHWVGVQYYLRQWVGTSAEKPFEEPPAHLERTQLGWAVVPEGFETVLRRAAATGLPVHVTENGIATTDDAQRRRYLARHLGVLRDVVADGVDVRSYFYWSAFDNYEWTAGYAPRFGLVGVDRHDDLRRVVRPSALAYRELIRTGRLSALELELELPEAQAVAAPGRVGEGGAAEP